MVADRIRRVETIGAVADEPASDQIQPEKNNFLPLMSGEKAAPLERAARLFGFKRKSDLL